MRLCLIHYSLIFMWSLELQVNTYLAKQLLLAFMVVVISLTCVVWLSQSLRFIDLIVNRGLPLPTFIYLTILLLPTWLSIVMPIAIFASSLYIYNRMLVDREIIVLVAAGLSPWRLSSPVVLVSLIVTILCYSMTLYFIPVSYQAFKELQFKIRHNYTDILLREGTFNAVGKDITVYIRERNLKGELSGIIINDERNSLESITVMAESGALSVTEKGPQVFMRNGNRQSRNTKTGQVGLLYFDSYTVDLSGLNSMSQRAWKDQNEYFVHELLNPRNEAENSKRYKKFIAEAHYRITSPLLAIVLPILGLAVLLKGEFSRRGQTLRICSAVIVAGLVECTVLGSKFFVAQNAMLIPIMYGTVAAPLAVAFVSLISYPSNFKFRPKRDF